MDDDGNMDASRNPQENDGYRGRRVGISSLEEEEVIRHCVGWNNVDKGN